MILLSITMTRPADVHWLGHETSAATSPRSGRGSAPASRRRSATAISSRPTTGCSTATRIPRSGSQAARDWVAWEDAILSLEEGYVVPNPRWADERYHGRLRPARDPLLLARGLARGGRAAPQRAAAGGHPGRPAPRPARPGRPPDVAWQLARAWPGSELHFVPGGHTGDAEMDRLLLEATDRFASRLTPLIRGPTRLRRRWITPLSLAGRSGPRCGVHARQEGDPMADMNEMAAKIEAALKTGDFGADERADPGVRRPTTSSRNGRSPASA